MIIGCPKEIKRHEYRVGLTPACTAAYAKHGHQVIVQTTAGEGTGFSDADYVAAGATMEPDVSKLFKACDMIVKVKEPQPVECAMLHEGQILFTYLHLASDERLTRSLLERKIVGIAYETIRLPDGTLPCLKPMSEIAGRLSIQEGAKYLEKAFGGRGVLLGGVPGVPRGKVVILGGGTVGLNAAKVAVGMGAEVAVLDIHAGRLEYIDDIFHGAVATLYSTEANLRMVLPSCDLLVGAVLIPGAAAPKLVRREYLSLMKKRAVIVDVAVDQGGCVETTKPTTHDDPVYVVDDVVHYAVANMPGSVSLTSTQALTSTTLSYGLKIADAGVSSALKNCAELRFGLNLHRGVCVCPEVAMAFGLESVSWEKVV